MVVSGRTEEEAQAATTLDTEGAKERNGNRKLSVCAAPVVLVVPGHLAHDGLVSQSQRSCPVLSGDSPGNDVAPPVCISASALLHDECRLA